MFKSKIYFVVIQVVFFLLVFAGISDKVFATDTRIYLSNPQYSRKISAGKSKNFRISGIPRNKPGQIRLKIKWHVQSSTPLFNKLQIQLRHGENRTLRTKNCYSYHANGKSPRCIINLTVSQSEATRYRNSSVDLWYLKVINNFGFAVTGFDIEKGNDTSVQNFRSVYRTTADTCVNVRKNIVLSGGKLNIPDRASRIREIKNIDKFAGYINLTGKWHANHPLMPYVKLKIQIIKPDGKKMKAANYYSIHSTNAYNPKLRNKEFPVSPALASSTGKWKIKVTNNSGYDVVGFDLRKGSDINPLIPGFNSYYQTTCPNN